MHVYVENQKTILIQLRQRALIYLPNGVILQDKI